MFSSITITPQIADTDMQGHINFLAYMKWFDRARTPIYRELDPTLKFKPHGMVILKTEVTYLKEVSVATDVEARSWISLIGNKSLEMTQEIFQNGTRCAVGKSIFCGFNFDTHTSEPLSDAFRAVLEKYRQDANA